MRCSKARLESGLLDVGPLMSQDSDSMLLPQISLQPHSALGLASTPSDGRSEGRWGGLRRSITTTPSRQGRFEVQSGQGLGPPRRSSSLVVNPFEDMCDRSFAAAMPPAPAMCAPCLKCGVCCLSNPQRGPQLDNLSTLDI